MFIFMTTFSADYRNVLQELENAKDVIADLEDKFKAECTNLRGLATEQDRLQGSKAEVLSQLQRTESARILLNFNESYLKLPF